MVGLNCISIPKTHILASSDSSHHFPPNANPSPPQPRRITPTNKSLPSLKKQQQNKNPKQPSVQEIERAIGAGVYRNRDYRDLEQRRSLFDGISTGESERAVEKKLRETGEWLLDATESTSRSAGKQILLFVLRWILPLWIFAFFVASGIVKLPFSNQFLEDLIL